MRARPFLKSLSFALIAAACACSSQRPTRPPAGQGGSITVILQDQTGGSFRLLDWTLWIDEREMASCSFSGQEAGPTALMVAYEGWLSPGEHKVTVSFGYRGHGQGVFSYLKGYKFRSKSEHVAAVGPSGFLTLAITGYERGGPTAPLEQRPAVRFEESTSAPDPMLPRSCPVLSSAPAPQ